MNSVIVSGRLSKDPELKYIPNSGKPVSTFDLAVENKYKKDNNNVDFFTVQCWNKLAECVANNLDKGRKVLVRGILKNNHWKDENGKWHRDNYIVASEVEFLDYPKENMENNCEFDPSNFEAIDGEIPI